MTRLTKAAFAALALAVSFTATTTEAGCGGGGGFGGFHAPSYGYSSPVYRPAPSYHTPSYQTPAYSTPSYSQPSVQQLITQPTAPQQITQPGFSAPQPGVSQPGVVQPQQQPQQRFVQQPPQQQSVPQPQIPQQAPVQQQPAPQVSALDAALQALGGGAPQQVQPQAPATPPAAPQHVGTFTANLSNGASVQLTLAGNGQFTWSATNKDGRQSSFSGAYTIGGTSLTLTRANDNQQLAGSLSNLTTGGFQFKLDNSSTPLSFVRA